MYSIAQRLPRSSFIRVSSGWMLACLYFISATGVPLPTPVARTSELFPCMHGRCGCRTAERCWKSCCCHTNREKLAWAKEHNVVPPAYVVAAAEREPIIVARKSCCARGAKSAPPAIIKKTTPSQTEIAWVSFLDRQRCAGEEGSWLRGPVGTLPPPLLSSWGPSFHVVDNVIEVILPFTNPVYEPPQPPPRLS